MSPSPRISVALCTYNGERFLEGQLLSILRQTRLPDEVVVCDDRSKDRTLALLQAFADDAPFPVRIVVNEDNLGSTRNFEKAVALCSGDLIAFSDQDDLWSPDRLQLSEKAFEAQPKTGLVFGDAELIDDQDRPLGKRLWQHYEFGAALQSRLSAGDYLPCVQYRFVTGATVMVRPELAKRCFPAGEGWIHDEWLAAAVPLFADLQPIPEKLISYRLHAAQQVGATQQLTAWDKVRLACQGIYDAKVSKKRHWDIAELVAWRTGVLCDRFEHEPLTETGRERLAAYRAYVNWLLLRLRLPKSRIGRIPTLVKHYPQYRKYKGFLSALKDLLVAKDQ